MFFNIQNITVPFLSAIDIFQYSENIGLTVSTTGSYYILQWANNHFNGGATGFNINIVSGSGFWQGSGFAYIPLDYLYDNFASYTTGFNSGYLSSGNQVSGYSIFYPNLYSGSFTSNFDYMYDNFASYSTGLWTQGFLLNGNQVSGYTQFFPNSYKGLFNFLTTLKGVYTTTDNANPNFIWSGSGINVNPGAGFTFPYLQQYASNSLSNFQGGTGGTSSGPYYAAGSGNVPYPWTGGGPVLVGNTAVNQITQGQSVSLISGGVVSISGFGTGNITGDFTLNIIWNWKQNTTPNSFNSWQTEAPFGANIPQYFASFTGIASGVAPAVGVITSSGGGFDFVYLDTQPILGGPSPSALNFGPNYQFPYSYGGASPLTFQNPTINNLNQDTALIDADMLSGFAIYLYTSMWSGITWIGPVTGQNFLNQPGNPVKNTNFGISFYTGMSSGLVINPYVYILGNKISGNLIGPAAPTGLMIATGITGFTGTLISYAPLGTGFYKSTGCFGGVTGYTASGAVAQFSGFGFGMAQYLTLTRTGSFVSLYQSGVLFATGSGGGVMDIVKPLLIGEFNRPTGIFTGCFSGFGLYHFEMWNYCQSQQTIANNILTYIAPPQPGLISSTNFILR